jgi:hypothetical protein
MWARWQGNSRFTFTTITPNNSSEASSGEDGLPEYRQGARRCHHRHRHAPAIRDGSEANRIEIAFRGSRDSMSHWSENWMSKGTAADNDIHRPTIYNAKWPSVTGGRVSGAEPLWFTCDLRNRNECPTDLILQRAATNCSSWHLVRDSDFPLYRMILQRGDWGSIHS